MILLKKKKTIISYTIIFANTRLRVGLWMKCCLLWCGALLLFTLWNHLYYLLFGAIVIFYLYGVIVFHRIHMPIVKVVFSLANILYTDYCLLLLRNWMWKTTLLLNVLLYVIISSLPNDEVMFLLLNYDLLKLGKSYKKAFFYLTVIYFSMYC